MQTPRYAWDDNVARLLQRDPLRRLQIARLVRRQRNSATDSLGMTPLFGGREPLEGVLQRELNDARAHRRGVNYAELRIGGVRAWVAKLRVVECIEKFGAELQRLRLMDANELAQRHIPI